MEKSSLSTTQLCAPSYKSIRRKGTLEEVEEFGKEVKNRFIRGKNVLGNVRLLTMTFKYIINHRSLSQLIMFL